ncbi:MAG: metalloregulator ArsR/SmtB family transcription factor [Myxococcota bacterium]
MDLEAHTALLTLFADPTRVRLLALLAVEELTVTELTRVTGLSQSRVSSHLGRLREAGALRDRKVGVSTFYRVDEERMSPAARRVWHVVREQVDDALLASDAQRCAEVLEARTDGRAWPDQVAGRMEHHYSPGRTWEALARGVIGLVDLGDVLDIGSGDGVLAQLLAPRSRSYTCVDSSQRVLDAAQARLSDVHGLAFLTADMHALPMPAASFDQVLMFHVLTYAERPAEALAEAFRVLRPRGQLTVVTLDEHQHTSVSEAYEHVNAGFTPASLQSLLRETGFEVPQCSVAARERKKPYFRVVTAFARRPASAQVCAS